MSEVGDQSHSLLKKKCKGNSYFDSIIKVFFENRNSIFIIWFIAFFFLPNY